jgi:hypothetical protein
VPITVIIKALKIEVDLSRSMFNVLCLIFLFTLSGFTPVHAAEKKTDKPEKTAKAEKKSAKKTTENATEQGEPTATIERSKLNIADPISENQLTANDIKHFIPASKIQTMLSGPDDFITLFSASTTAINKGVAILLPDWQESATSPKAINSLRKLLPAKGWTTIVIQPPNKPLQYPVQLSDTEKAEQENEKLLKPYISLLSAMLKKVREKADDYPGLILVIAQGNNAAITLDLFERNENKAPSALVLLSAYRFTEKENEKFAMQIANSVIPILDLSLEHDNKRVIEHLHQRKAFAEKELKVIYRQQQLTNFDVGYYPEDDLIKAISGWLKAIGW